VTVRRLKVWQYYVPDLTGSNETHHPDFKLEYTTFQAAALETRDGEQLMLPKKEIPKKTKKYTPYGLEDLTVGSWVGLASRLGDPERGKLRTSFRKYMYLGEEQWFYEVMRSKDMINRSLIVRQRGLI
jgi:endopolyphosphatase